MIPVSLIVRMRAQRRFFSYTEFMESGKTWADQILDAMDSGIDESLIRSQLKLTPQQRLERLQAMQEFIAYAHQARRISGPDRDSDSE